MSRNKELARRKKRREVQMIRREAALWPAPGAGAWWREYGWLAITCAIAAAVVAIVCNLH